MISYTSFSFFLLYFGITFVVYSLLPKKLKWCVLLIGSYVFYFISARGNILPLIIVSFLAWAAGILLQRLSDTMRLKRKNALKEEKKKIKKQYLNYQRLVLALGVVCTVAVLLVCKYSNFFIDTANSVFSLNAEKLSVIQPLGLSFFVLETISYMADVYYGRIKAEKNPFRVSLYLSFMLTVVEGPIARFDQLGTQLNTCKYNNLEDVSKGFMRVLWGLFKKIVIADRAVILVNSVFDNYEYHSSIAVAAGIAFYTLQLYCEFSGVMDIMCGLGNMLGIQLPENFERPFFAKSINEFWQRWHISLGTWLRDYIFYPISLSKGFTNLSAKTRNRFNAYYANLIPTSVALFFVWFTNGFWHGAGWKYIVYGLYYYTLMMLGLFFEPLLKRICNALKINRESTPFNIFRIIRTVIIVNIGMLIFRADNLKTALYMFRSLFTDIDFYVLLPGYKNGFNLSIYDYAVIGIGFIILLVVGIIQEKGVDIKEKIYSLPMCLKWVILIAALFVIIIFGAYGEEYGVVDLIYANF